MKFAFTYACILAAVLFMGCKASAQQFRTHAVKQGETLYSISRQYQISTEELLRYNKELGEDSPLQPNTILSIPVGVETISNQRETVVRQDTAAMQPVGFRTHRVRRKETIFSITSRYDIEEAELKRFNPALYSKPLQKGMVLRIPEFPEGYREAVELEQQLTTYVVQPKETRWSIAHKYGISMDSLLSLNPELPRSTNYLAIDQELRVPVLPGETIEEQEVEIYRSYTVPPKKTLFSLSREFGLSREEIIRLNPEIMERGNLQEGMVLRLPEKAADTTTVNAENFIFYQVRPKQTQYSLTRKLGVGWAELLELNPDLAKGLKAGMVLKLPKDRAQDLEVKNALILDAFDLKDSINPQHIPKILVLYPFRLDRLNLQDAEGTQDRIQRNNALKYSLGLYTGMLVAVDSIAEMGISVELTARDTRLDTERVRTLMLQEDLGGLSAIVGPLDPRSLREVAARASDLEVPVIAPVPVSGLVVPEENVFYTYTGEDRLRTRMLDYVEELVTDQKILIISDQKNQDAETQILERFPAAELIELRQEEENVALNLDELQTRLSEEAENWVFVETDDFKIASSVTSILNSSNSDTTSVRMFTTNIDRVFDNPVVSANHLSNLKFTFPSVYKDDISPAFRRRYRRRFGGEPDRYAARGFDLGMDLLLRLAYNLDLFQVADQIGETEYSANKFNYIKNLQSGYYNTSSYILMYDGLRIKLAEGP